MGTVNLGLLFSFMDEPSKDDKTKEGTNLQEVHDLLTDIDQKLTKVLQRLEEFEDSLDELADDTEDEVDLRLSSTPGQFRTFGPAGAGLSQPTLPYQKAGIKRKLGPVRYNGPTWGNHSFWPKQS